MRFKNILFFLFFCNLSSFKSQDTFSILAFDSISNEIGAAGASCVDLFQFPGYSNDFITEIFPGEGAIATQAAYINSNQINARNRMILGDSPTQLINWLIANDIQANPLVRQYGVIRMNTGYPQSAAFTGSNCMNYKNHITGPNYSIQGNILLGQLVLDSMEKRFNREKGNLACKLMAAMQGANMIGADSRCSNNLSSSLFAFLKVSQPNDAFGNPSFLISLKTHNASQIEPIDSLQKLFSYRQSCMPINTALPSFTNKVDLLTLFPNPTSNLLTIKSNCLEVMYCEIKNSLGETIHTFNFKTEIQINTSFWQKGLFFIDATIDKKHLFKKIIVN